MSNRKSSSRYHLQPFRRAVLRGFGVVLPPLLTIVILLWIGNSVQKFVLNPVEWGSRQAIVWFINETKQEVPDSAELNPPQRKEKGPETLQDKDNNAENEDSSEVNRLIKLFEQRLGNQLLLLSETEKNDTSEKLFKFEDKVYVQLANGEWIPDLIHVGANENALQTGVPLENVTGRGYYDYYVEHLIFRKALVIPVFLAGFILLMYLLGKFLAAGIGRILWNSMEAVITQLPIIRTVYTSVKQVTDFFVGESDIEFKRVVAVEYPRRGMWSVGFVTGESMSMLRNAVDGDPVMSILMPTSPIPGTGFTVTVRKSETIDLDIPIEQALQFVVSCGVVVPNNQIQDLINTKIGESSSARQIIDDVLAIEQ